jgi:hypothetical protein
MLQPTVSEFSCQQVNGFQVLFIIVGLKDLYYLPDPIIFNLILGTMMINACGAEYEAFPPSLVEYLDMVHFVLTGEIV